MNYITSTLTTLILFFTLLCSAQATYKIKFLDRWDNNLLDSSGNQTFNSSWGYTATDGKEYAIMGSLDSTYFFQLTDSNTLKLVDVEAGKTIGCIHREYKTKSHYAYGVADEGSSSLQIFDLQYLPDSVHKVYDSDTFFNLAHDISIEGNRLYCTYPKKRSEQYGLTILSIDTPDKPSLIVTYPKKMFQDAYVHEMYSSNDTGYLSCGYEGFYIYDLRNPLKPLLISHLIDYPQDGFNHSSILSKDGNYLYFTDEDYGKQMKVFSLKKTRNPSSLSKTPEFEALFGLPSHSQGATAHNQYVVDGLMFVSYYHEGVAVYDIGNPIDPQLVDKYDTYPQNKNFDGFEGCWNVYPYYPSKRFIASDQANGMFLFKLDTIVSINEVKKEKMLSKIYGEGEGIVIDNKDAFKSVRVYSIEGKFLFYSDLKSDINTMPLQMRKGLFIVELSDNKGKSQRIKVGH